MIGGGPAGSAAALAARRAGASVLLLDSAEFPRDKVCGDGIAPHVLDVLAQLGVDPAPLVAGCTPVHSVRLRSPGGVQARGLVQRPGYVVPRVEFDHRLRQAVLAAGVDTRRHTVRRVRAQAGGVDVDGLRADVVIGADGAESVVRRQLSAGRPRPGTVALAIRGYAPSIGWPSGELLLTMTRQHSPAYAWLFPIGDGRANVGYGELLSGAPPTRSHLLRRLHELLPGVQATHLRAHRLPLSSGRVRAPDGRVLLAGDAAGLINPVTGEGIFYAVLSGALAGLAAASGNDPGRAYRHALQHRLGAHLRHTDALAHLSRWPRVLDVGLAAARGQQDVFDNIIDLGLGDGTLTLRTAAAAAIHWRARK